MIFGFVTCLLMQYFCTIHPFSVFSCTLYIARVGDQYWVTVQYLNSAQDGPAPACHVRDLSATTQFQVRFTDGALTCMYLRQRLFAAREPLSKEARQNPRAY